MYYLFSFNNKVRVKDRPFARLDPVHECTTTMGIQSLEGCHSETLLITVVVRELGQQKCLGISKNVKFYIEVDLNICHNFCIGHFDQRSTIFN
jgi:hypothetical protein